MERSHVVWPAVVALCVAGVAAAGDAEAPLEREGAVVEPKALSPTVEKGLAWLADQQLGDGGWGQGEESARMGGGGQQEGGEQDLRDVSNVADTCMAALALIRGGSSPVEGPHSTAVRRAIEFVVGEVEAAGEDSPWVTDVRGTRVQQKIGPHVDTFLAALLLVEVKDGVGDEGLAERVEAALAKTLGKIERHQGEDGRWAGGGWAGGLSNALAAKAVNRAALFGAGGGGGAAVDERVRQRAARSAQERSEPAADGRFADDGRSAGIELYAAASAVGELSDAAQANQQQRRRVEAEREEAVRRLDDIRKGLAGASGGGGGGGGAAAPAELAELRAEAEQLGAQAEELDRRLEGFDAAEGDLRRALRALEARLDDDGFLAGFGTNGGEEFISYLNIGEALVVEGGEAWERFDRRMTENLSNVQNADGSWTGHHCITGRTFCTSAALLVLLVDRSPQAIADKLDR